MSLFSAFFMISNHCTSEKHFVFWLKYEVLLLLVGIVDEPS